MEISIALALSIIRTLEENLIDVSIKILPSFFFFVNSFIHSKVHITLLPCAMH